MDWIIAGFVGWCGTGWPIHFHVHGGGGGWTPEPGDWGPPGCWVCGKLYGAIGGIAAFYLFGSHFANAGMLGTVTLAFFGGSFLAEAGNAVTRMVMKK